MDFNNDNKKPEHIKENWEGKWKIFSWMEFVTAIPQVLFLVTTKKENGLPNLAFQTWSTFTGEGNDYFIIMGGLMKSTHTYKNIKRTNEFCVNFINDSYIDNCWKSIKDNDIKKDEIQSSGFNSVECNGIDCMGIKESFIRLECSFEWEKELVPNSTNALICGKVKNVYIREDFAKATTDEKFSNEKYYMMHLHNPINPYTGECLGGGVGYIEKIHDM